MPIPNDSVPEELDLELLSPRERDVVDRAIDGYTDEQIAQSLAISTSTVNSYWVRIRTKVGHRSRTEIVAAALRREMAVRCAALEAEIEKLKAREAAERETYLSGKPTRGRRNDEPWRYLAVAHLSEAVLIIQKSGTIIYANPQARKLLRAARHELEGLPFWELSMAEEGGSCEAAVHEFFANNEVRRTIVGQKKAYYARRRDNTLFRVTIAAEWYESPDGIVAVVSLREFSTDASQPFQPSSEPITIC